MKDIKLVEIDSELGAGTRGASAGIDALKVAAFNKKLDLFARLDAYVIDTCNERLWDDVDTPHAKRIEDIQEIYEVTADLIATVYQEGGFPVVLSGDHSTAGGTIAGLKAANPDRRLGVVWVDAHADVHTPYTTPSGNVHGMPLTTALNMDNLENRVNHPSEIALEAWEQLKATGIKGAKLQPQDLVFVGVRDTEAQEEALMAAHNIVNHTVEAVREQGPGQVVSQILEQLRDCDLIYVSFDVDSMDPDIVSYGTGTPVKNGLTPEECTELLTGLVADSRVGCFEMVEVNPCLDNKVNFMAETAVEILQEVITTIESRG